MNKYEILCERIRQFNNERDWNQFHSPANLAKSISVEAGELLECFQWNDDDYDKECVIEELSDIVNYCIQMAQILDIDLVDETNKKIDVNEIKYPVNKAKGVSTKYNKL